MFDGLRNMAKTFQIAKVESKAIALIQRLNRIDSPLMWMQGFEQLRAMRGEVYRLWGQTSCLDYREADNIEALIHRFNSALSDIRVAMKEVGFEYGKDGWGPTKEAKAATEASEGRQSGG